MMDDEKQRLCACLVCYCAAPLQRRYEGEVCPNCLNDYHQPLPTRTAA